MSDEITSQTTSLASETEKSLSKHLLVHKIGGLVLILLGLWCFKHIFWGDSGPVGTWMYVGSSADDKTDDIFVFHSDGNAEEKETGKAPTKWRWRESDSDHADLVIEITDHEQWKQHILNTFATAPPLYPGQVVGPPSEDLLNGVFHFRIENDKLYDAHGNLTYKRQGGGFFGFMGSCFMFFIGLWCLVFGGALLVDSSKVTPAHATLISF
jgi:hypothetical protein